MAQESENAILNRKRAFKPKVSTGCLTCKTLAPAPAVESSIEARALELFFHKTATQLAGSFEAAFFQGSVAQLSLVEPTIRHAIAAIAILHEELSSSSPGREWDINGPEVPVQCYNRAIRALLQKFETEQTPISLTSMANILFTCFEYFQGNLTAARSHVKSGIKLLESWRENTRLLAHKPWGQSYDSYESYFMETEIAPLLTVFRINILDNEDIEDARFYLNPVDKNGDVVLGDRFENIQQARAGLLDVITSASGRLRAVNEHLPNNDLAGKKVNQITHVIPEEIMSQWETKFDDLISRQSYLWGNKERQAANIVRIINIAETLRARNYMTSIESSWDSARAEYEEMLSIADSLISDHSRFPNDGFRLLSLDFGMLFCFHLLAWKCRWPSLRRWALSLLCKVPKREWLFDPKHYHAIFSRILEIEEGYLGALPEEIIQQDLVPPENARIYDFTVIPQSSPSSYSSGRAVSYSVTFWSKPMGLDGPLSSLTEYMLLEASQPGETAVPSSFIDKHHPRLRTEDIASIGPRSTSAMACLESNES
ncbi:hypothetical protein PENSUB_11653 [Penicillium subrubescens]|uniref:Uncharacterized protein n=1 Tax=Penicillium subrubescens TaxID=1316194 RepID=A0A1Q5T2F8_9EURO|nr:hypothetical protein PENSUB_11653 [Penicillium subrubescens]